MIKKLILIFLTIVTARVCYAQQTTPGTMPSPNMTPTPVVPQQQVSTNPTSFSNVLQRLSFGISNTDLQLSNSYITLQPTTTTTPTKPLTSQSSTQASPSEESESLLPSISIPGVTDTETETSSRPATQTTTAPTKTLTPSNPQQVLLDSLNAKKARQNASLQKQLPNYYTLPSSTTNVTGAQTITIPATTPNATTSAIDSIKNQNQLSRIYGKSFFQGRTLKVYNNANNAVAPDDYVLGVGDEISIAIWGFSSYNQAFYIDQTGSINPTETGRIYLKGMTFKDAKDMMRSRFGQVVDLHNSQIDFTLIYARDITVNIVGEVMQPGSYHIPAINTAFNALIAANGPNGIGSVRNIFIKRDGKTIKTLDVYKFLQDPNSNEDFFLQNNDYIFVPAAKKIVEVSGEVYRPMSYELLDNENLFDIIKYAGGLKADAYTKTVQITRYQNSHSEIIDVDLDSLTKNKQDFALVNGDVITISALPSKLLTYVEISGPVKIPGQYEFDKGMKISDLLSKSQGATEDAYLDFGYVVRTLPDLSKQYIPFVPKNVIDNPQSADNIVLHNQDMINIFQKSSFQNNLTVTINGAVHMPGSYTFGQGLTLRDLLLYAGGLLPTASNNRIEISRVMKSDNGSPPYSAAPAIVKTVQIGNNLTIDQASESFQLQPYDIVFVRQAPAFNLQTTVSVSGEVVYPGTYVLLNKGERIASLITRAGGPTAWAFLEDATLKRAQDSTGYVISNLKKALKDTNSKFNVLIKPGDSISIPAVNDVVAITGAVNYPFLDPLRKVNVPFHKGWHAKHYIKAYGDGFAPNAWRTHSYVIQPGGRVQGVHRFLVFNCYPKVGEGGGIFVGYKTQSLITPQPSPPINWTNVIKDTTTKIIGLLTLYLLVDKLITQ